MWTESNTPIFEMKDNTVVPTENWNTLLNNARKAKRLPDAVEALGDYIASGVVHLLGFSGLGDAEVAFIEAAEPPMTREEERQFSRGISRIWGLEEAFNNTSAELFESLGVRV